MYKSLIKITLSIFLSILLINSNSFAFHKYNNQTTEIYEKSELTKEEIAAKHCALKVKKWTEDGAQVVKDDLIGYKITGYHKTQKITAPKKWDFEIPANNTVVKEHLKKLIYLEVDMFLNEEKLSKQNPKGGISLEEFLKVICLQYDEKERPQKFEKNSSMHDLFLKIAEKNQLLKNDKPNIKEKLSTKIYTEGLIIDEPNVVYFIPDYLIAKSNKIELAKLKHEETVKANNAEKDWIAQNKQPLLDEIDKKISEFDDQIKKINNSYDKLKIDYENFIDEFKNKIVEVEDLLEDVDRTKNDIKEKAKVLRSNKREFLNTDILDNLRSKFKSVKKVKGKHYDVYKSLDNLRDAVAGSNKKSKFTKKKKGYLVQWERLKNSKLNDKQQNNINDLDKEIKQAKSNITNNIDNLILEIENLEEEFGSKLPWNLIIIGIVVLIIIIGVGTYVYLNNRRIQKLQEEADKKVGSLKSDLEGRLKDTSEQIRSVGRAAARSGQTGTSQQDQVVEDKPKTQEEIIAAKYDDLISDYREALDDFTKVVKFKQKWNGLALSRKERQDGTKTILISSPRAFEKADIWCVTFSDKYFAFAGSTVRSNMATYMNLDFEKASREFKGVFSISTGTNYTCEPSVLRKGGAGFVVERAGKIVFPT